MTTSYYLLDIRSKEAMIQSIMNEPHLSRHMARRGFLARLAALVGCPLAIQPDLAGQQQTASTPLRPAPATQGRYYRSDASLLHEDNSYYARSPWHQQSRRPVLESTAGNEPLLLEAIQRNEVLYGTYDRWGDRAIRRISPIQLFHVEPDDPFEDYPDEPPPEYHHDVRLTGPTYLLAWDHDRHAPRTFLAEYVSPLFTAPWMHTHAGALSPAEWNQRLRCTEQQLRNLGIQPVSHPA